MSHILPIMERIRTFYYIKEFERPLRVLPPQPDRVVVTDFVTATFLYPGASDVAGAARLTGVLTFYLAVWLRNVS